MANEVNFLLIGGGLASATAAETLRKEGAEGKITIISAENFLPYHRPPLSKSYLLKDQKEDQRHEHADQHNLGPAVATHKPHVPGQV